MIQIASIEVNFSGLMRSPIIQCTDNKPEYNLACSLLKSSETDALIYIHCVFETCSPVKQEAWSFTKSGMNFPTLHQALPE